MWTCVSWTDGRGFPLAADVLLVSGQPMSLTNFRTQDEEINSTTTRRSPLGRETTDGWVWDTSIHDGPSIIVERVSFRLSLAPPQRPTSPETARHTSLRAHLRRSQPMGRGHASADFKRFPAGNVKVLLRWPTCAYSCQRRLTRLCCHGSRQTRP